MNSSNCGEKVFNDNQQVDTNISKNYKLILNRKKNFIGSLVSFSIYIDNKLVGKIKNGQTLEFEVSGGVHQISINKNNAVSITINTDTTADVVVFGTNNFGITNINGQSINNVSDNNYSKRNETASNIVLIMSIIVPIISIILYFLSRYYIAFWIYAIIIGYCIVNIAGLKNQKCSESYKKTVIKNIIAIIISIVSIIITVYLTI